MCPCSGATRRVFVTRPDGHRRSRSTEHSPICSTTCERGSVRRRAARPDGRARVTQQLALAQVEVAIVECPQPSVPFIEHATLVESVSPLEPGEIVVEQRE